MSYDSYFSIIEDNTTTITVRGQPIQESILAAQGQQQQSSNNKPATDLAGTRNIFVNALNIIGNPTPVTDINNMYSNPIVTDNSLVAQKILDWKSARKDFFGLDDDLIVNLFIKNKLNFPPGSNRMKIVFKINSIIRCKLRVTEKEKHEKFTNAFYCGVIKYREKIKKYLNEINKKFGLRDARYGENMTVELLIDFTEILTKLNREFTFSNSVTDSSNNESDSDFGAAGSSNTTVVAGNNINKPAVVYTSPRYNQSNVEMAMNLFDSGEQDQAVNSIMTESLDDVDNEVVVASSSPMIQSEEPPPITSPITPLNNTPIHRPGNKYYVARKNISMKDIPKKKKDEEEDEEDEQEGERNDSSSQDEQEANPQSDNDKGDETEDPKNNSSDDTETECPSDYSEQQQEDGEQQQEDGEQQQEDGEQQQQGEENEDDVVVESDDKKTNNDKQIKSILVDKSTKRHRRRVSASTQLTNDGFKKPSTVRFTSNNRKRSQIIYKHSEDDTSEDEEDNLPPRRKYSRTYSVATNNNVTGTPNTSMEITGKSGTKSTVSQQPVNNMPECIISLDRHAIEKPQQQSQVDDTVYTDTTNVTPTTTITTTIRPSDVTVGSTGHSKEKSDRRLCILFPKAVESFSTQSSQSEALAKKTTITVTKLYSEFVETLFNQCYSSFENTKVAYVTVFNDVDSFIEMFKSYLSTFIKNLEQDAESSVASIKDTNRYHFCKQYLSQHVFLNNTNFQPTVGQAILKIYETLNKFINLNLFQYHDNYKNDEITIAAMKHLKELENMIYKDLFSFSMSDIGVVSIIIATLFGTVKLFVNKKQYLDTILAELKRVDVNKTGSMVKPGPMLIVFIIKKWIDRNTVFLKDEMFLSDSTCVHNDDKINCIICHAAGLGININYT